MKTTYPDDDDVPVNPAAFAEEIRKAPMNNVDYRVIDEDGNPRIPADAIYREGVRARNLGAAAGHRTYSDDLAKSVIPAAAVHDAHEATLMAAEPRRAKDEQVLGVAGRTWASLQAVPHNFIEHYRKVMAHVAKVVFLVGDTAVLANQLYRSGSQLVLALLVGLALAGTVVMIGTQCGRELGATKQRQLRGNAPTGSPPELSAYYDSGNSEEINTQWLHAAYAAAGIMFLALFFLGVGSGDPAKLAMGYGLLGMLTVAGSACAEAYATNEVASKIGWADRMMEKYGETLKQYEAMEARSASAATAARLNESAARHTALSADITVGEMADRLTDTPEVAGYVQEGEVRQVESAPRPTEAPVIVSEEPKAVPRDQKRPALSIAPDNASVDPSEGGGLSDDLEEPDPDDAKTATVPDHSDGFSTNGSREQVTS